MPVIRTESKVLDAVSRSRRPAATSNTTVDWLMSDGSGSSSNYNENIGARWNKMAVEWKKSS